MNEIGAKKAIQNLLIQNESDIFFGIVQYDVQRKFQHVTRSVLTPATGYYFVGIDVNSKGKRTLLDPVNDLEKIRTPFYEMNVTIVDYLGSVAGEKELFEVATDDFNIVTDRIVELIDPEDTIAYFFDGNSRFRLVQDTEVTCRNEPSYFPDTENNAHASMMAEITFQIEDC